MDLQCFEFYSHVITHVVRQNLPIVDSAVFEAAVEETVMIVLTTLDRHGERQALRRLVELCELETKAADRPGDALRAALAAYVSPPDRADVDTAASNLLAVADELYPPAPESPPSESMQLPRGAREQLAELVRFLLDMEDTEPFIFAIAARLIGRPEYEAELLASDIRPELLREIKDYATLLTHKASREAAAPPPGPSRSDGPGKAAQDDPPRSTGHAGAIEASDYDAMMSYASEDLGEVNRLLQALEQFDTTENRALRVWIDHRDLLPGSPVLMTLCEVIRLIRKYVFCCGMQLGRYQKDEMQHMVNRVITGPDAPRIMPVILASVAAGHHPVPPLLETYSYVDLRGLPQEAAVVRLRKAIRA